MSIEKQYACELLIVKDKITINEKKTNMHPVLHYAILFTFVYGWKSPKHKINK